MRIQYTTIGITPTTKKRLEEQKKSKKFESYDELINFLLDKEEKDGTL